jgi:spermidine synthase
MLVHPAMHYACRPQNALVIGGGDGGAIRELAKYPLQKIELVEIDKRVVELSREFLPSVSNGAFADNRVQVHYEDAFQFLKTQPKTFDVIIGDGTDCYGPSEPLWSKDFFETILQKLSRNGVAVFQTGYFKERYAAKARKLLKRIFPYACALRTHVGCFPIDESSFVIGSRSTDFSKVEIPLLQKRFNEHGIQTAYYSPEIHAAAMVIPKTLSDP